MPLGLLGKKLGSTRVYDARGVVVPVTVVLAGPNRVLQVKTQAGKDGYNAVQLGFDDQKEQRLTKALLGHIKKRFLIRARSLTKKKLLGNMYYPIFHNCQRAKIPASMTCQEKYAEIYCPNKIWWSRGGLNS